MPQINTPKAALSDGARTSHRNKHTQICTGWLGMTPLLTYPNLVARTRNALSQKILGTGNESLPCQLCRHCSEHCPLLIVTTFFWLNPLPTMEHARTRGGTSFDKASCKSDAEHFYCNLRRLESPFAVRNDSDRHRFRSDLKPHDSNRNPKIRSNRSDVFATFFSHV